MVSVDIKHHVYFVDIIAQELCESRGGRPGLPVPSLMVSVDVKHHERRRRCIHFRTHGSCVGVEVAVLGSPSLIVRTVSVDVKQHLKNYVHFKQCPGAVRSREVALGTHVVS